MTRICGGQDRRTQSGLFFRLGLFRQCTLKQPNSIINLGIRNAMQGYRIGRL